MTRSERIFWRILIPAIAFLLLAIFGQYMHAQQIADQTPTPISSDYQLPNGDAFNG